MFMYSDKQFKDVLNSLLKGGLILCGGNGGSFTDSMHFVAELTGRFDGNTKEYPAIAMGSNQAELTAFGNDYGYENIFIPYINAFKKFDPSFLLISTSGTSKNVIAAINHIKKTYNNYNISLLTGAFNKLYEDRKLYEEVNILSVKSESTQTIQETHIEILHKLAKEIKGYNVF